MSSTLVGSLLLDLRANHAAFGKDMRRANNHVGSMRQNVNRMAGDLVNVRGLLAGLGAFGLIAMTKRSLEAQDAIGKLAQRLGASVEELSSLQFVAEQTGVRVETLNMGLQRMVRRISEAAQGSGEAVGALDELGLSADRLNQMRPGEQFRTIADAISQIENPADRVRIAMRLFDSEGVALIQTLSGGSEEIIRMQKEADRLGRTLTTKQVQAAAAANDAMNRLKTSTSGLANILAIELAPTISALSDGLANTLSKEIDNSADVGVDWGRTLAEVIAKTADVFKAGLKTIGTILQSSALNWAAAVAASSALVKGEFDQAGQVAKDWFNQQKILWAGYLNDSNFTAFQDALKKTLEDLDNLDKKNRSGRGGRGGSGVAIDMPTSGSVAATDQAESNFGIFPIEEARQMLALSGDMAQAERERRRRVQDVTIALETQTEAAHRSYRERLKLIEDNVRDEDKRARLILRNERQLTDDLQKLNDQRGDEMKAQMERIKSVTDSAFGDMESALVQFAKTGELSVARMVDSILSDLARLSIQRGITGPLSNTLSSAIGGAFFGGGEGAQASATGQAVADLGPIGPAAAPVGTKSVRIEVNNNNAGGRAEIKSATVERRPNGDEVVRLIQDVVADDAQRGGKASRAMASAFGLSRRPR